MMGIESMRVEAFPQQLTRSHIRPGPALAWLARPREFGRPTTPAGGNSARREPTAADHQLERRADQGRES